MKIPTDTVEELQAKILAQYEEEMGYEPGFITEDFEVYTLIKISAQKWAEARDALLETVPEALQVMAMRFVTIVISLFSTMKNGFLRARRRRCK